ncbi:MAG: TRAP transporter large permease subunit [Paracoccaceae bacterium]
MEFYFLALLLLIMAAALGSGYPVAFALPGSAILTVGIAAGAGWIFTGSPDAYFHSGGPSQWLSAGVTNLRGVYWDVDRDTLIAIPLFIFMGIMLQRSKIAEDLLVTMAGLFGPVPGGLGISVVFVGALLAATTGIVGATVVAMGMISLPAMLRNNYSPSLATGTIAASGTLGQIIPPSIVLIILADQLASATDQASTARKALHKAATGELSMPSVFDVSSTSAGEMFLGALAPGLVLVGLYMLFILVYALLRPSHAPAVPVEGERNARFWINVVMTLVPPLALILLVLGSIIAGIATVNQAGAIGAAGAMLMAGYRLHSGSRTTFYPAIMAIVALGAIAYALANYSMNLKASTSPEDAIGIQIGIAGVVLLIAAVGWSGWRVMKIDNTLQGVMLETAKTTSLVFIILLGAAMLTAAFRAFGGEDLVRDFLQSLPGGFWSQFVIVMLVIFVLGFFLDFIEIAVVVVPIVAPILLADPGANITAVWLGVMIGLNIQTSFLTPPFGFALFYLRGVAPAVVRTVQMYRGVIAFICLQLTALVIVGLYPPLVNYLPARSSLLGETAPPPKNPRLQACLTDYVRERLVESGDATMAAIVSAKTLDASALPQSLGRGLSEGVSSAETALAELKAAFAAEQAVAMAAPDYRPLLTTVRRLQRDIRDEDEEIQSLETRISRMRDPAADELKARLTVKVEEMKTKRDAHLAVIPAEWEGAHEEFSKLIKAEDGANSRYQRAADEAWEGPAAVLATLNANEAFFALRPDLEALGAVIEAGAVETAAQLEEAINAMEERIGSVEGAGDVRSALSKSRRAVRERSFDLDEAMVNWRDALSAYDEQVVWRNEADSLKPGIEAYLAAIRETIGARAQPRLNRDQALHVASCTSVHRDVSLHF